MQYSRRHNTREDISGNHIPTVQSVHLGKESRLIYLQTFSQFKHIYEKSYQVPTGHLTGDNEMATVVDDSHFQTQLRELEKQQTYAEEAARNKTGRD